jgi:peptide/nickel transport system substrate-binding protein
VYTALGTPETQVIAQAQHELDVADLSFEALRALLAQSEYSRCYRAEYPWVFNGDPCTTGISFNTIKAPFDNKEVRWALNLAIDIVSYIATAYDGAATINVLHTPATAMYMADYYAPMQPWLEEFTIDLGDGETFQPYDPTAPQRLAEYAEARGYPVPEDVTGTFGYGWWKYAPDEAAKLLEKNGFSRDADGNWLQPDGTPWKFTILTGTDPHHPAYRNAFAAAYEWRKFGIDIEVITVEEPGPLERNGEFDASSSWPSNQNGSWGGHPDLERLFDHWNSKYLEPVLGEPHYGHLSRWTDPRIDQVCEELKSTDWNDLEGIIQTGMEGLKITIEEMPAVCSFLYPGVIGWDTYYWTNWPGAENSYIMAYAHWPNFKYMLPSLEPTGN